jgi:hypothetical protein
MKTPDNPISPDFLPAGRVAARYAVSPRSLDRWLEDARIDFPRPLYIGRMRFFRVADLEAWEAERARRGEEAAAVAAE